jgi:hypothetical protein
VHRNQITFDYLDAATGRAAFEKHFLLRTVALGDCGRPYGTPCVHEHACVRCPFLRMNPAQLPRLNDIESNTRARLDEARRKTWLGEVAALEESLAHIARKRSQALELLGQNNSLSAVISDKCRSGSQRTAKTWR